MKHFINAQWIFADGVEKPVRDRYFVYKANLHAPKGKATLYISAHCQYAVYVNGSFVNFGQYDDYEDYQVYDTLDLSDYLKTGDNELWILQYVCGMETSTRSVLIPGVIFAAWDEDNQLFASTPEVLSGEEMRYVDHGELYTWQLGFNFSYNSTLPEPAFKPSILAGKEKNLFPRPIQKLTVEPLVEGKIVAQGLLRENDKTLNKAYRMQTAYLSASRQEELFCGEELVWNLPEEKGADGIYMVADMGGEMAGLLSLSLEVPQDTEVLISIGEHLEDLRVRSGIGGRSFCFRYVAKAGENIFTHTCQRFGLRYIQLHIYSQRGKVNWVGLRPTTYPLTYQPNPMTDRLHRKIWEVGCKTLHLCMHEHYEDCPWREQSLYAMDSRVQILCGYYAFKEHAFPRATLSLMARSLRPDGLLELCPPGKAEVDIPCFTAVYVREIWEYLQYTKDLSLVQEVMPVLRAICDGFLSRVDETGLLPLYRGEKMWNFYEWQPGLQGHLGVDNEAPGAIYEALLCAFVVDALRCFAKILRQIGATGADGYEQSADALAKAVHTHFYDPTTGGYLTRLGDTAPKHALTQALMLFVQITPETLADKVAELITGGTLLPCSISMTIYAFEALLQRFDQYREYVLAEIDRIWGRMLFSGADTFWETEVGANDFDASGSLCHGWSAVPIYIFSKYFLQ